MVFYILIFILGLLIGSFLAAFSYRLPKQISIVKGRSFCPNCKKQIVWFDNIPLFSYIILRGKCRNCKKHISWRYPLIELATGLGFFSISYFATNVKGLSFDSPELIFLLIIFSLLVLIFVIDLEQQIIPDSLIFFGLFLVFAFYLITNHNTLFPDLFAGFFAATLLMLIHLATRGRGMGLGDVKFAIFGGMIVGVNLLLVWLFLSFLTGAVAGSILILIKRAGLKDKVAFGPFLIIGLVLTFLYGNSFIKLLGF